MRNGGIKMTKLSESHRFNGDTSGFLGVINAIKLVGIKQWIILCFQWHTIVDEGHIWNVKSGH